MTNWKNDDRELIGVHWRDGGVVTKESGYKLEKIEYTGEHCMIPWVRSTAPNGAIIESPIHAVETLVFRA